MRRTVTELDTHAAADPLTRALEATLSHPETSADVDFHRGVSHVLADVG